jgi:hypothetical protein
VRRAGRAARCLAPALLAGCGLLPAAGPWRDDSPPPDYRPDRREYAAFRAAWPELHEPNYLPFMAHRVPLAEGRGAWVFCRWDDSEMPLPVYIAPPVIAEAVQDEFNPRDPARYVAAVEHALETWERELDGRVSFRRVDDPAAARIAISLRGEPAPVVAEAQVLGSTRLGGACDVEGRDPDAERLRVHFHGGSLTLYLADEFGLLPEDQVEWVALHELGHALGMRGHSPIPADLMYEVVRDRVSLRDGLSMEDGNSFASLYALPNGTVFSEQDGAADPEREPPPPPSGPPMLAGAPHVDSRLGFRVRLPHGWMRVETEQGVAAVDGVTWDYSASYQVVISRQPDIDSYLERYGAWYASRGELLWGEAMAVNGRRALQGVMRRPESGAIEEITLIESGDGRVVVTTAECAAEHYESYAPWFDAVLASLEIDPETP